MSLDPTLAYAALVVFAGYVVLGITGFGSALIVVPLLAWKWPLPQVVALVLLLDLAAAALHGGLNAAQVRWRELGRLAPGLLLGSLLGLWLTGALPPRWPLLALGLFVAGCGWRALRAGESRSQWPQGWALGAGTLAGTVEMMFGTAGPLLVAWLAGRLTDVRAVRATTPVAIVASAALVLAMMAWAGPLRDPQPWLRCLVLLAPALAGVWVGHVLARRVAAATLKRCVCVLLIISGLVLFVHALR